MDEIKVCCKNCAHWKDAKGPFTDGMWGKCTEITKDAIPTREGFFCKFFYLADRFLEAKVVWEE